MSRKTTPEEYESRVKSVWGDHVILLTPYKTRNEKVLVHYNDCGHEDYKDPLKLLSGQGCSLCRYKKASRTKTKTHEQFVSDLKASNLPIETLSEYTGVNDMITVRNTACGHVYSAIAGNILRGSGCPVCHGMKDTETFKQQVESAYPGEYEVLGCYVNNRTKIRVRHKCGFVWDVIPKDLLKRYRCPNCNKSYGEHLVMMFLESHNLMFDREKWFSDCRDKNPLPFDFIIYTSDGIKAVEVDGQHHFGGRSMYASDFERIKRHDSIKNRYCKDNGIPLLRIPFNRIEEKGRIASELSSFLCV